MPDDSLVSDVERDLTPRVVCDRCGRRVTVWYSRDDLGATIGNDGDILLPTSAGCAV